MEREGRKADGKYYLKSDNRWVEVSEEVYKGFMPLVWKQEKAGQRQYRCFDGSKRCTGNCEECLGERNGRPVSLDQLLEDDNFDIPDKRRSVEDTVIMKLMIEEMYRQIGKLPKEEQFIIAALFLYEEPLSQKQVGAALGITQQMVSKKRDKALATLREAMKGWED